MKWYNWLLIGIIIALVASLYIVTSSYKNKSIKTQSVTPKEGAKADTCFVHDTVWYPNPMPMAVFVTDTVLVQVHDTVWVDDELYMRLEVEKKTYQGVDYWAQVSGIECNLDSIMVRHTTAYIERPIFTEIIKKPKVSFGVQLGFGSQYGLIGKKFDVGPYLGIGLQYNF